MGIDPTRGFVAFPRGLTDWEWYTEPNTARLFFHLLLTANWQEKQWQGITIHPGELVTSRSSLAKQLRMSEQSVRTALEHLRSTSWITIKAGPKYSVISINNYQVITGINQLTNQPSTSSQPAANHNLTIKTNQQADKSSSSPAGEPTPTRTTTSPMVKKFEAEIGKLSAAGKAELTEYAARLGDELTGHIIHKCSDTGGRSWAYVRKALLEAESGGYHSVEEYQTAHPIGAGRNKRVDRQEPSGSDWLTANALNRNLKRMKKRAAKEDDHIPEP